MTASLPIRPAPKRDHNARTILVALGIGHFNASAIIPYLFMAPAQVDADMPAIQLLVEAIQKGLNAMGAALPVTGDLDIQTVLELKKIVGPAWLSMPWFEIAQRVARARDQGVTITPSVTNATPVATGHTVDMGAWSAPAPATLAAIAGGGVLLWLLLAKRKRPAARKGR